MLVKKRIVLTALLAAIIVPAIFIVNASTNHPPLNTIDFVDSDKFTGEWYVISNIPYFGERNKVASKTTYMKIGDHEYQDIFEFKNGSFDNEFESIVGKAICLNKEHTKWQSTFYSVIKFKFEILDVDEDYQVMVIGHRSRDYGWVMARNSRISDLEYQQALETFGSNGYDIEKFAKVPQHPADLGQPGFQLIANN